MTSIHYSSGHSSHAFLSDTKQIEFSPDQKSELISSIGHSSLVKYLYKNGDYENLKKQIIEYESGKGRIEKLLLEEDITELPTRELVNFVFSLQSIFDLNNIVEFYSRSGLLAGVLQMHVNETKINCTVTGCGNYFVGDNFSLSDDELLYNELVNQGGKYSHIRTITTGLGHSMSTKTMLIINWSNIEEEHNVNTFMSKFNHKVKIIMVIGDIFNRTLGDFLHQQLVRVGRYKHFLYKNIKQISFLDHLPDISNSKIMLYIHESIYFDVGEMMDTHIFHKNVSDPTINTLVCELIHQKRIPEWVYGHENMKEILHIYTKMCKYKYVNYTIPPWIHSYDDMKFWSISITSKLLPSLFISEKVICNTLNLDTKIKDEFDFYKKIMTEISELGLQHYRSKHLIVDYIKTVPEAEKYIYTMFSLRISMISDIEIPTTKSEFIKLFEKVHNESEKWFCKWN